MKYIKTVILALMLCVGALSSTNAHAAVVYSDSGTGGSGSAYLADVYGFNPGFVVNYDSYEWSAFYDDAGTANFSYTLYTSSGNYSVFSVYGGPPPPPGFPPAGWQTWSYYGDLLWYDHPDFLDAFWLVAPQ
jgi:hypothetical protein